VLWKESATEFVNTDGHTLLLKGRGLKVKRYGKAHIGDNGVGTCTDMTSDIRANYGSLRGRRFNPMSERFLVMRESY
jgi:hypothetical protein